MAGSHHDMLVELLRNAPRMLAALLREHGVRLPPSAHAQPLDPSARQLRPVEFDADLVLRFAWRTRRTSVIVEVQRKPDDDKRRSCLLYLAHFRTRSPQPVELVVIATNRHTAEWAREPIIESDGRLRFTPLVLGPDDVPVLDDEAAREQPGLAMLSARVHLEHSERIAIAARAVRAWEHLARAEPAMRAREQLDPDTLGHYLDTLMNELGAAEAVRLKEVLMEPDRNPYRSPVLRELHDHGKAEGRAEAVLDLLELRGVEVDSATCERVMSCTDLDTLRTWLARAATASTLDEVFPD